MSNAEARLSNYFMCCTVDSNSDCGGYISAKSSGHITTPNYPSNYSHNMHCIWLLAAPTNYYIQLNLPMLQMEGNIEDGCQDSLEVS